MSEASDKFIFSGVVDEKGRVNPDQVNVTRGRLAKWKGRRVTVTVARYVKPKTQPQLALYFRQGGILDAWCDYIGDDRDCVHADLKDAYLVPLLAEANEFETNKITGEMRPKTPSLADTSATVMSAFIDRIVREGTQRGIVFDLRDVA